MDNRKIVELDLNDILPNRFQPRIKFNESSITELAESIKEHGVIQPIVVRPLGDRYEIIAGERRYKASVLAGKETIQAIVTELNDKDSAEVALIENVQRQDLTPIEEAISYNKILDMGYLTQEELALKLGKTQSTIANKLRLLKLDDAVQEALLESKISERHARSLLKLTDKNQQKEMLAKIINERLTVRKTDEEINKMMNENDNKNIEIIDFGNVNTPEQPAQGMNYNIPTSPIVEEPVLSTPNMGMPTMENVAPIAPVIPDIPVAPVQEVVQPPVSEVVPQPALTPTDMLNPAPVQANPFGLPETDADDSADSSAEAMLKPGKFFNLSDLENETPAQSQTAQAIAEPINSILTDPMMNIPVTPVQEEAEPQVAAQPEIGNFVTNFDNNVVAEKPAPIIPANPEPLVQTPISEPMSNQTISAPAFNGLDTSLLSSAMPEMNVAQSQQNNMKQAIDLIRECAAKIQALGFEIETEEYDFEDMYQSIFKINKK